MTSYITVAIPYVNADPHLGYAFELVEADLAVRARRAVGEPVRFLGGTDDYSLKNVVAAEAAGEPTATFVDRHADRFEALAAPLGVGFDDFIRTSRDPRHRPAVERLWRACADDLYRRDYTGRYCVGCEQYVDDDVIVCPEHLAPTETVTETNWFYRLSRYGSRLVDLVERGELRITPEPFRREVLAFLRGGLVDISVSRSVERARGWGIPVPGDPEQVIYVWFDALTNYISALGYGDEDGDDRYERWWRRADDRVHVIGKGIIRFHAVFWPAFLLSAGEPLPTRLHVHPYLTVDGAKISKSSGDGPSPVDVATRFGSDALRWWFAADVSPSADTDFTVERLVDRANETLTKGFGNAVNRVATLRHRHLPTRTADPDAEPIEGVAALATEAGRAFADFDRRRAAAAISDAIDAVNRHIESTAPWRLARDPGAGDELAATLDRCAASLVEIAGALTPVAPGLARRAVAALNGDAAHAPQPVYGRVTVDQSSG